MTINDVEAWNAEMLDRISRKNGKRENHLSLLSCRNSKKIRYFFWAFFEKKYYLCCEEMKIKK